MSTKHHEDNFPRSNPKKGSVPEPEEAPVIPDLPEEKTTSWNDDVEFLILLVAQKSLGYSAESVRALAKRFRPRPEERK